MHLKPRRLLPYSYYRDLFIEKSDITKENYLISLRINYILAYLAEYIIWKNGFYIFYNYLLQIPKIFIVNYHYYEVLYAGVRVLLENKYETRYKNKAPIKALELNEKKISINSGVNKNSFRNYINIVNIKIKGNRVAKYHKNKYIYITKLYWRIKKLKKINKKQTAKGIKNKKNKIFKKLMSFVSSKQSKIIKKKILIKKLIISIPVVKHNRLVNRLISKLTKKLSKKIIKKKLFILLKRRKVLMSKIKKKRKFTIKKKRKFTIKIKNKKIKYFFRAFNKNSIYKKIYKKKFNKNFYKVLSKPIHKAKSKSTRKTFFKKIHKIFFKKARKIFLKKIHKFFSKKIHKKFYKKLKKKNSTAYRLKQDYIKNNITKIEFFIHYFEIFFQKRAVILKKPLLIFNRAMQLEDNFGRLPPVLYKKKRKVKVEKKMNEYIFLKKLRYIWIPASNEIFDILILIDYGINCRETAYFLPLYFLIIRTSRKHTFYLYKFASIIKVFFIIKKNMIGIKLIATGTFNRHARSKTWSWEIGRRITGNTYTNLVIYDTVDHPLEYGSYSIHLWIIFKQPKQDYKT